MPDPTFGRFDDQHREFVITRPDTPTPWINYLTNDAPGSDAYHALISNTGGGFSYVGSPRDGRIQRFRYNALPADRPGRYVYHKDRATGAIWSPTWQPTLHALEHYECRHGFGYTRIRSATNGIETEILYFVPVDGRHEFWDVRVRNARDTAAALSLHPYAELCLGHAFNDLINQPNDQHFPRVWFDAARNTLLGTRRYHVVWNGPTVAQANRAWGWTAFLASSRPVRSFETSLRRFVGPYRSEQNPLALEGDALSSRDLDYSDPAFALDVPVDLAAGAETRIVFVLGVVPAGGEADALDALLPSLRDPLHADRAFAEVRTSYDELLSGYHVDTPAPEMDRFLNLWNRYQTLITFRCSRNASYYHGGLLFGRGTRDAAQDILGPVIVQRDATRRRVLELFAAQFPDGSAYHCTYPVTGGGEKTGHTDTPLWLPMALGVWLREHGDLGILDEIVPFAGPGGTSGSVLDHARAALDYCLSNTGIDGLPRFGPGDWNDTLDYCGREGRGVTVWGAEALAFALRDLAELLDFIGRGAEAAHYRSEHARLARVLNEKYWCGSYYIRGRNDWDEPIGAPECPEGKIFLNAQSWAVISGIASRERGLAAMVSARTHLDTRRGPKLLAPAYRTVNPRIGLATRCVPGKKENGAIFNHAAAWAVQAEAMLGNADRALSLYSTLLPSTQCDDANLYRTEPYVYSEYVTSDEHESFGEASHSWLTGSSDWFLRAALDHILGVRPTFQGLAIAPAVPDAWTGYEVMRRFRGATYRIAFRRVGESGSNVAEIRVEGSPVQGSVLPIVPAGNDVRVEVSIGPGAVRS